MLADIINGSFEALASLFILNHCRVLWRQKQVRGVSIVSTSFFFTWGVWNIAYYPMIGQPFSFACGVLVTAANALCVGLMWHYRKN